MAANNLRIIYDNQVDYPSSTVTASSTASVTTAVTNLKSDTRSLVWRSANIASTPSPIIIKSSANSATSGVHSNVTVSTAASSGTPTLYYTLTNLGGTEAGTAVVGATTTSILDTAAITGLVLRTYDSAVKTTLLDYETIPVLFSVAGVMTAALSNDFHRVATSADGLTFALTNSGTNVYSYDGSTPLRYNTTVTSAGVFTVSAVGSSVGPGTFSSGGNGGYAVCSAHSTLSANTGTVTFTVAGRKWDNTAFTSTAVQTIVKSLTLSTDPTYSSSTTSTVARAVVQLVVPTTTNKIEAVALPYSNLSIGSTIRILGYNAGTATLAGTTDNPVVSIANTPVINTNHILCCPFTSTSQASWTNLSYGTVTWGLDRQLARAYVPLASQVPCTTVVLDIVDPNSVSKYIEASRLICGEYWSPKYNTEYGLSVGMRDTSETNRSESGDLITSNGVVYKTMNFNMNHLTTTDRDEMVKLLRNAGRRRGLFVSLFPDNAEDWEQESLYQLYGKLSDTTDLSHPYYQFFATTIQLEEI